MLECQWARRDGEHAYSRTAATQRGQQRLTDRMQLGGADQNQQGLPVAQMLDQDLLGRSARTGRGTSRHSDPLSACPARYPTQIHPAPIIRQGVVRPAHQSSHRAGDRLHIIGTDQADQRMPADSVGEPIEATDIVHKAKEASAVAHGQSPGTLPVVPAVSISTHRGGGDVTAVGPTAPSVRTCDGRRQSR
ncbi:hypothetical protein GCM10022236_41840 [Microlunatus ginsengisoli]|uniref:Uncharacterized protein n=2 Tax=Microlunatus ginsengisoli TaxID=363863 RepID=A0ABP7AKM5_9ACTN